MATDRAARWGVTPQHRIRTPLGEAERSFGRTRPKVLRHDETLDRIGLVLLSSSLARLKSIPGAWQTTARSVLGEPWGACRLLVPDVLARAPPRAEWEFRRAQTTFCPCRSSCGEHRRRWRGARDGIRSDRRDECRGKSRVRSREPLRLVVFGRRLRSHRPRAFRQLRDAGSGEQQRCRAMLAIRLRLT